jgi:cytochrome c oxidase assembly protein subunit 15/protoheme IX farnesyltransferase
VVAPIHLVNTLFLVGSLALTAWWSSHPQPPALRGQGGVGPALGLGLLGLLLVAASGAVTSLGDALFPVRDTAEAIARSRTPGENFLVYLRLYHPFIAIGVSLYAVVVVGLVAAVRSSPHTRWLSRLLGVLFLAQLAMGYFNVKAAAALYTQLPHLLLSDLVWIGFLLFSVTVLSLKPQPSRTPLGEVG